MKHKELEAFTLALATRISALENKVRSATYLKEGEHKFNCANCGNVFVLNDSQHSRRLDKNRTFYCSAGHSNSFSL